MDTLPISALFIAFIALVVLFLIGSMIISEEPTIEVQGVKITSLTRSTMNFDVKIEIINPYPLGATVTELAYTITAQRNDEPLLLATGTTEGMGEIKIAGSSTTDITIPAQVNNSEIVTAGLHLLTDGDMEIVVSGAAKVDLWVLQPSVPFSKQFTITKEEVIYEVLGGNEIISGLLTTGANIASKYLF
ncbi:MAG: LEA type 2 family protein [Euryarchaeota archaeon]|nr:LEA type 2 family protein [Euryarchaeota archaeon]